jgi:hypothetical protein
MNKNRKKDDLGSAGIVKRKRIQNFLAKEGVSNSV